MIGQIEIKNMLILVCQLQTPKQFLAKFRASFAVLNVNSLFLPTENSEHSFIGGREGQGENPTKPP